MHKKLLKTFVAVTTMVGVLSTSMVAFAAEDYTVQSGDSLKRIAKQSYGDETKWEVIYEANKGIIKNPNLIYKGQVLIIPDLTENEPTSATIETTIDKVSAAPPIEEITPIIESNPTSNAAFEQYGLVCNAELDTTYPYVIPCYDEGYTTNGKVTFSDYEVFESDETHIALDGYEWKAVTCTIIFDDENAYYHGYSGINPATIDYYNVTFFDNYEEENVSFTSMYNGTEYNGIQYDTEVLQNGWNDDVFTYQYRDFYRVPKGYDGIVMAIYNPSVNFDIGNDYEVAKANGDTILFRLK